MTAAVPAIVVALVVGAPLALTAKLKMATAQVMVLAEAAPTTVMALVAIELATVAVSVVISVASGS